MKKFLVQILMIVFLTIPVSSYAAGADSYSVAMNIRTDASSDPEYNEGDEYGHRMPQRKINCHIDRASGVIFLNAEVPDVIVYEIVDINGNCVAAFGDEDSFVDFLFTLNGEYQLKFTTTSYDLVGYVYL